MPRKTSLKTDAEIAANLETIRQRFAQMRSLGDEIYGLATEINQIGHYYDTICFIRAEIDHAAYRGMLAVDLCIEEAKDQT